MFGIKDKISSKFFNIELIKYFILLLFFIPFFEDGHIIFSDIAVGYSTKYYLSEIFGIWNERYSSTTLLNLPRLFFILPSYVISIFFGSEWLIKSFVVILCFVATFSQSIFLRHLFRDYLNIKEDFFSKLVIAVSSLMYAVSPWFIVRIQHVYLLCGYALFPLIIHYYLSIFNVKYRREGSQRKDYLSYAIVISLLSAAIHYFFFSLIVMAVLIALGVGKKIYYRRKSFYKIIRLESIKIFYLGIAVFLSCAYWFLPYFYAVVSGKMSSQANINVEDTLNMFSRNSSLWNVITGNSYWWNMLDVPAEGFLYNSGWLFALILILIGVGGFLKRNSLIQLFSVTCLGLLICSLGSYYSMTSYLHEFLVFKIPVIGKLFRDPNKLVGVINFFYSCFFALGLYKIIKYLGNKRVAFLTSFFSLLMIAFATMPFYKSYILNHYNPTNYPSEFTKTYQFQKPDRKTLFLPQSENRINYRMNVASLNWNKNLIHPEKGKSVGDISLYGTRNSTVFQYEGNHPRVSYFYSYLQKMIDQGRTNHISGFLRSLGFSELFYTKGYSGFEDVEAENHINLGLQKGLSETYKSKWSSFYELEEGASNTASVRPYVVYSTGGMDTFDFFYSNNTSLSQSLVFSQLKENNIFRFSNVPFSLHANMLRSLYVDTIGSEFRISPFDHLNRAAAHLRWAKSSIYKYEWEWFQKSLGLDFHKNSIERTGGVAVTLSDAMLDIKAHEEKHVSGPVVYNLDSLNQSRESFLNHESPDLQIQLYPGDNLETATVSGSVSPGKVNGLWRIAKSKSISVKASHPYLIRTGLSGKDAEDVHIKVHFYDDRANEIGVGYVSRPDKSGDFFKVRFNTFLISPRNTSYMKVNFLSPVKSERRVQWWLHQFDVEDLGEYKKSNSISFEKETEYQGDYDVFISRYKSPRGGEVRIDINDQSFVVESKSLRVSKFEWVSLGKLSISQGITKIKITNLEGFNALGDLVLVPSHLFQSNVERVNRLLASKDRIVGFEGETDFSGGVSLQSDRNHHRLSGGKGLVFDQGTIASEFEISTTRSLAFRLSGLNLFSHNLDVKVLDLERHKEYVLTLEPGRSEIGRKISHFSRYNRSKYYYYDDQYSAPLTEDELSFKPIELKEGRYQLSVSSNDHPVSLSVLSDVVPLYTKLPVIIDDQEEDENCCQCIYEENLEVHSNKDAGHWSINALNTCQWKILQSKVIDVSDKDEYFLSFRVKSHLVKDFHQKIIYLGPDGSEVGKTYIPRDEFEKESIWYPREILLEPPPGSVKAILIVLFKPALQQDSRVLLDRLRWVNYSRLPLLDSVYADSGQQKVLPGQDIPLIEKSSMKRRYETVPQRSYDSVFVTYQTLHKIWSNYVNGDHEKAITVNSFVKSIILHGNTVNSIVISITIRIIYFLGLPIFLIIILIRISIDEIQ